VPLGYRANRLKSFAQLRCSVSNEIQGLADWIFVQRLFEICGRNLLDSEVLVVIAGKEDFNTALMRSVKATVIPLGCPARVGNSYDRVRIQQMHKGLIQLFSKLSKGWAATFIACGQTR
jgi:hypothetical protein